MKIREEIEGLKFWSKDWGKERFKNPTLKIMGGPKAIFFPVPHDVILCDFCNAQITEFPVAVYLGNAMCLKCFAELKKDIKAKKEE